MPSPLTSSISLAACYPASATLTVSMDGFRIAVYNLGLKDNGIVTHLIKFLRLQPVVAAAFRPGVYSDS